MLLIVLVNLCLSRYPVSGPPKPKGELMIINYKNRIYRFMCTVLLMLATLCSVFAAGKKDLETVSPTLKAANSTMRILGETADTITFQETTGKIVELPKRPTRTIVCLNSILDVWYMAGGTSLARVQGDIDVPPEAMDLPLLGTFSNLNTERIMELEPDFLIFTNSDTQFKVRDLFTSEGVPSVRIDYQNYDDFRVILELFSKLNDNPEIYHNFVQPLQLEVQEVIQKIPAEVAPSVCILFASTTYVKVETESTVTGDFVKRLGGKNIYAGNKGETRVDLSLEYILEQNPDIIFVTTMGDVDKCKARLQSDIIESDIWGALTAVKNGRWYYLDKSYSIYKPNRFYPEAFRIMSHFLYPELP